MPTAAELTTALRAFPIDDQHAVLETGPAAGFSGARIWRLSTLGQTFCLRRWPREHPSPERLRFIHAVLGHLKQSGLEYIAAPIRTSSGASFVQVGEHLWELSPWLPGKADFSTSPTSERLRSAMVALAEIHLANTSFRGHELSNATSQLLKRYGPPQSVGERHERLERLVVGGLERLAAAIRPEIAPSLTEMASEIVARVRPVLGKIAAEAASARRTTVPLLPVFRDVWHDHVLFMGKQVTGLIDYGATRVDTVATDLSRILGSLCGVDRARRDEALAAYCDRRPLTAEERFLVDVLDRSSVVLSAANWVEWVFYDERVFEDVESIAGRLAKLLDRLKNLRSLGPLDLAD